MAPWTKHWIESQLEKVTVFNYEEISKKIVSVLDSRSRVQNTAILLVENANKWYSSTFSERLDKEKRNLCDNFISSILHEFAIRTKPIRQIPTEEGLSGIPLLKADLMSVFVYRKLSIGSIASSLYNSGNLSLDDVLIVLRACLDDQYIRSNLKHLQDSILLLEFAGRELDNQLPNEFQEFMKQIRNLLKNNHDHSSKRVIIGARNVASLYDRYFALLLKHENGWQISPYGKETNSNEVAVNDDVTEDSSQRISVCTTTTEDDETTTTNNESMPDTPPFSETFESCMPTSIDGITDSDAIFSPAIPSSGIMNDKQPRRSTSITIPSPWNMYFANPTKPKRVPIQKSNMIQSEIMIRDCEKKNIQPKATNQLAQKRGTKPSTSIALEKIMLPIRIPNTPFALTYSDIGIEQNELNTTIDKTPTMNDFQESITNQNKCDSCLKSTLKNISSVEIDDDDFTSFTISPFDENDNFDENEKYFITVYFSSEFKIGDARRIIDLFYTCLRNEEEEKALPSSSLESSIDDTLTSTQIPLKEDFVSAFNFSIDGSAIQKFQFYNQKEIRIKFSSNLTLIKTSKIGQKFTQIIVQSAI